MLPITMYNFRVLRRTVSSHLYSVYASGTINGYVYIAPATTVDANLDEIPAASTGMFYVFRESTSVFGNTTQIQYNNKWYTLLHCSDVNASFRGFVRYAISEGSYEVSP